MRIDPNNPVYREIRAHVEERLAHYRSRLEIITADAESTAVLRGRIDELKRLLKACEGESVT